MRNAIKCLLVLATTGVACGGSQFSATEGDASAPDSAGSGDVALDGGGVRDGTPGDGALRDGTAPGDDSGMRDGAADSGTGADAAEHDSACGPTNTIDNCGACGARCERVTSSSQSCSGASCQYTCVAGRSDCNAGTAPDTDGCECATPSCCGAACATVHFNGIGQNFYDCVAARTFNLTQAMEACAAATGNAAQCSAGGCLTTTSVSASVGQNCVVWAYGGGDPTNIGHVKTSPAGQCLCPQGPDPPWD